MKRFPAGIMCTCVLPWDEHGNVIESLFTDQVNRLLKLTPHLYIFGTAGEGHAVTDAQFESIAKLFDRLMRAGGSEAMVGVISLSLPTILQRIRVCHSLGIRKFQISLPSWGALTDSEVKTFFREVCGRFRDCQFLHYNLMRTKRLIEPELYATLASEHSNLVATKNSSDSLTRLQGLMTQAPELQHFVSELGYTYASQLGECGLLSSIATNQQSTLDFYEAGRNQDRTRLFSLYQEISQLVSILIKAAGPGCHIDSAYDKMLWKLQDERFPLRLLPPYEGSTEEAFQQFAQAVRSQLPRWIPESHAS